MVAERVERLLTEIAEWPAEQRAERLTALARTFAQVIDIQNREADGQADSQRGAA